MALTTYLYENPAMGNGKTEVNGIKACLYTIDPAVSTTTALRVAAVAASLTADYGVKFNDDYFATETLVNLATTLLPALADRVVFGKDLVDTTIA